MVLAPMFLTLGFASLDDKDSSEYAEGLLCALLCARHRC